MNPEDTACDSHPRRTTSKQPMIWTSLSEPRPDERHPRHYYDKIYLAELSTQPGPMGNRRKRGSEVTTACLIRAGMEREDLTGERTGLEAVALLLAFALPPRIRGFNMRKASTEPSQGRRCLELYPSLHGLTGRGCPPRWLPRTERNAVSASPLVRNRYLAVRQPERDGKLVSNVVSFKWHLS